MRVVKDEVATLKRRRRITVEVDHGEVLMSFHEDRYYRLGGQVEDIVHGNVITESDHVTWCSIEQRWTT